MTSLPSNGWRSGPTQGKDKLLHIPFEDSSILAAIHVYSHSTCTHSCPASIISLDDTVLNF